MRSGHDLAGPGGFVFLLYILWGPIVEAGGAANATRAPVQKAGAIFEGVARTCSRERIVERKEQADGRGARLELVENRPHLLCLQLEARRATWARCVSRSGQESLKTSAKGMRSVCLVLSERPDFHGSGPSSDAWSLA